MIANDKEYEITKGWVERFKKVRAEVEAAPELTDKPLLRRMSLVSISEQIKEFERELAFYKARKAAGL